MVVQLLSIRCTKAKLWNRSSGSVMEWLRHGSPVAPQQRWCITSLTLSRPPQNAQRTISPTNQIRFVSNSIYLHIMGALSLVIPNTSPPRAYPSLMFGLVICWNSMLHVTPSTLSDTPSNSSSKIAFIAVIISTMLLKEPNLSWGTAFGSKGTPSRFYSS